MDKKWTMVFVANGPYIQKAINTIQLARTIGEWKDDIVLLVSSDLYSDETVKGLCTKFSVIMRKVPERNFDTVLNVWKKHPEHSEYKYVMQRTFIWNKFYTFDTFFRRWDYVFYLDSGAKIQGSLERMKKACVPDKCIYAHSDAYPSYQWKLIRQFSMELFDNEDNKQAFIKSYSNCFDKDYFQTTLFIYDTSILEDDTVEQLFKLNDLYPISIRADQGIANLYFHCERGLWKQIPVKDYKGFLYDFLERDGFRGRDYLILKYPRFAF